MDLNFPLPFEKSEGLLARIVVLAQNVNHKKQKSLAGEEGIQIPGRASGCQILSGRSSRIIFLLRPF
jgi:hypothetical protein